MFFPIQTLAYKAIASATKGVLALLPSYKPVTMSGAGSATRLAPFVHSLGWKKTLIVTDEVLVKLGVIQPLLDSLTQAGVEYVLYDKVLPDPDFTVVEKGLSLLKSTQCDSVIAIGGGSSIDAAKIIKVAATHDKTPKQLAGLLKCKNRGLPFAAIPTTAGTGAEVTIAAVMSDPVAGKKIPTIDPKLVPDFAVLDPELMLGLPPHITSSTAIDALTHAIEAYISKWAAEDTDALARSAIKLIFSNLEEAYNNGKNIQAREALINASYSAGLAFSKANIGYVHAIAHQFGGVYHTPHGLANAIVLPHILEFNLDVCEERFAQLALVIGAGESGEPNAILAQKFIDSVKRLNENVGIPNYLDALQEKDIIAIAKAALKEAIMTPYPVPKYMKKTEALVILHNIKKPVG